MLKQPETFQSIWQRAAERKGGDEALEALLPQSNPALAQLGTDRILSAISSQIFKSGFVWRIVEAKWPAFEEAFWGFQPQKLLMMSPEQHDQRLANPALIRHAKKIQAIFDNAQMLYELELEVGNAGQWLADWDSRDIVGLWQWLKQHGNRLGGNTGPYFLRSIGKDTFLLTQDTFGYLKGHELVEGAVTSKKAQAQAQAVFNHWQDQSGLELAQISRVLSCSVGDNRI